MIWVSIILGIIQAIPTLITVFKAIMDKLHGLPTTQRLAAETEFHGILQRWHSHPHDKVALEKELHAFEAKLA